MTDPREIERLVEERIQNEFAEDLDAEGFGYWPDEAQAAIRRRDAEITRLATIAKTAEEREDERLQLRAAFYKVQERAERAELLIEDARDVCARPRGVCFPPVSERESSAAVVDGADKPSASGGHHETVGERQGRQPAPAPSVDVDAMDAHEAISFLEAALATEREAREEDGYEGWTARDYIARCEALEKYLEAEREARERAEAQSDTLLVQRDRYRDATVALESRAERFAEALRWYGDELNYDEGLEPHPTQHATGVVPIEADRGSRARAALTPQPDEEGA